MFSCGLSLATLAARLESGSERRPAVSRERRASVVLCLIEAKRP